MGKTVYKNSIESKRKIASAYLTFIAENNTSFTVTDIVKRVGINRGTFYLHFSNLDSVKNYIEDEISSNFRVLEQDFRQSEIDKCPEIIISKVNEIFSKDINFYKLIINTSPNTNLMDMIKGYIINSISNNFKIMKYVMNYDNFKMIVQYIVGGVLNTYSEWFRGHLECSLDDLALIMAKMIKVGVRGYLSNVN